MQTFFQTEKDAIAIVVPGEHVELVNQKFTDLTELTIKSKTFWSVPLFNICAEQDRQRPLKPPQNLEQIC